MSQSLNKPENNCRPVTLRFSSLSPGCYHDPAMSFFQDELENYHPSELTLHYCEPDKWVKESCICILKCNEPNCDSVSQWSITENERSISFEQWRTQHYIWTKIAHTDQSNNMMILIIWFPVWWSHCSTGMGVDLMLLSKIGKKLKNKCHSYARKRRSKWEFTVVNF